LWRQARKKRYDLSGPPRAMYMLVPYLHLPGHERLKIALQEQQEGKTVWFERDAVRWPASQAFGLQGVGFGALRRPLPTIASIPASEARVSHFRSVNGRAIRQGRWEVRCLTTESTRRPAAAGDPERYLVIYIN